MPTLEIWLTSAAYAIILGLLLFFTAQPLFGILQQECYGGRALMKWYYRRRNEVQRRYSLLTLAAVLVAAFLALCFSFGGTELSVFAAFIGYAGMCALYVYSSRYALKVPMKRTPRVIRLSVCFYIILAAILFGLSIGFYVLSEAIGHPLAHVLLRTVPLALAPLLFPLLLALANAMMKCYEIPHTKKFINLAKKKLEEATCLKVGITGSFAKTSVKHFAAEILSKKFRVLATPASYNTPVGIAKFVNEAGCDCDIFLAEMGARKRGDIQELADMVCPSFAVITGICPQHLETFGSLEAIKTEKGVLANYAESVVLGASACELDKAGALLEGRDFSVQNVVCTRGGTSFELLIGGERVAIQTKLLGLHAAQDVALAGALAFMLGMPIEEIAVAASALTPVPHRLEHLNENGLDILDDSYNSNVAGAKNAVAALRLFGGKRYVVTPGLVELGEMEEQENARLGAQFVGLEGVILVGETRVLSVRQGYLEAGGEEARLKVVSSLQKAQEILAEELAAGDAVLFLNDLPDKYV
ncbi:MAG: UDP-N-acetylmuramoyl-tripeptide--D-alanyl-D-alanine ligase [Clostridia bacterium]|nr:UDP-N-acetylmuramoyl-tripeptide--D-alanyl-D-alanine ligase [Clostridia bacterium]